jgi:hypothetical protein
MSAYVGFLFRNLFPTADGYPLFSQPGGKGTAAVPQQAIGEIQGIFRAGCGHSFNAWTLLSVADPDTGQPVWLVCCPVCSYVQNAYTPDALQQMPFVFG